MSASSKPTSPLPLRYTEFSLLSLSCSDYLSLPAVGLEIKNRLQVRGRKRGGGGEGRTAARRPGLHARKAAGDVRSRSAPNQIIHACMRAGGGRELVAAQPAR